VFRRQDGIELTVGFDYEAPPIWAIYADGGDAAIDPSRLPISDELRRDLWAATGRFSATDPFEEASEPEGGWPRLEADRVALALRLQQELGSDYLVRITRS
jgi:hypothetical protein